MTSRRCICFKPFYFKTGKSQVFENHSQDDIQKLLISTTLLYCVDMNEALVLAACKVQYLSL